MQYQPDWPPQCYYVTDQVSRYQLCQIEDLVDRRASETEIDKFLRVNQNVLSWCLRTWSTGHHGTWVVPQQDIRPSSDLSHGLRPDYLVGGKSSNGISWHVLELKCPGDPLFVRNSKGRLRFSEAAHEGVFQLMEYIDYCSEQQAYLRDALHLKGLREPSGLLVIGNRDEFQESDREAMKASWHRIAGDRLVLTTYDALVLGLRNDVEFFERESAKRQQPGGTSVRS